MKQKKSFLLFETRLGRDHKKETRFSTFATCRFAISRILGSSDRDRCCDSTLLKALSSLDRKLEFSADSRSRSLHCCATSSASLSRIRLSSSNRFIMAFSSRRPRLLLGRRPSSLTLGEPQAGKLLFFATDAALAEVEAGTVKEKKKRKKEKKHQNWQKSDVVKDSDSEASLCERTKHCHACVQHRCTLDWERERQPAPQSFTYTRRCPNSYLFRRLPSKRKLGGESWKVPGLGRDNFSRSPVKNSAAFIRSRLGRR